MQADEPLPQAPPIRQSVRCEQIDKPGQKSDRRDRLVDSRGDQQVYAAGKRPIENVGLRVDPKG